MQDFRRFLNLRHHYEIENNERYTVSFLYQVNATYLNRPPVSAEVLYNMHAIDGQGFAFSISKKEKKRKKKEEVKLVPGISLGCHSNSQLNLYCQKDTVPLLSCKILVE